MRSKGNKNGILIVVLGCIFSMFFAATSWSQPAYPTKPINLYIGYAPGGVADISVRFMASKAEKILGQPFIITNNGGGGSSVATGIVAKKPADGYTILGGASSGLVRLPHMQAVPYKYEDFAPIMHFATPELTPVVTKSTSPWKTFKELVDYAKKNPGKITYSTLGVGSPMHMAMEFVAKQEKISWTHVPFPGAMPAFTALLGDHVNVCVGAGESVPYIKDGTVRILANLSEKRVKAWPNVPTLREMGYDIFNESVFMFSAPKGTPQNIIEKLQNAFRKVMDDPEFTAIMAKVEFEPSYRNAADTKKYLDDANKRIAHMVQDLKLPRKEN
ncbi:MAG TPA: tripartite tricarboxylate transporter substrate binding protein [Syntrophorhabdaceae bacterium]|nr:tripartite tricarboxylate transporter substrate binding protein [Syntrophorhabdaceae bacterium]